MTLEELGMNRFGYKTDPVSDSAEYMSEGIFNTVNVSEAQDRGFDTKDARQIVTGTVIVSSIFRTSDFTNRVELNGNDIFLYNNTYLDGAVLRGDSARLVFGRLDRPIIPGTTNQEGMFVMEERTSVNSDDDNVLSWYATAPASGHYNWMFIGRNGLASPDDQRNLGSIHFAVDEKFGQAPSFANGVFELEMSRESIFVGRGLVIGDARMISPPLTSGFSAYIAAEGGGVVGMGYHTSSSVVGLLIYILSINEVILGAHFIPDTDNVYDIGTLIKRIGSLYVNTIFASSVNTTNFNTNTFANSTKSTFNGSVVACPLPTVLNALEVIKKIPEPTKVGDRGHYGDGLYFDDLTFPEEVLWEIDGKKEIEHTHMIGLLMQAVRQLTKKVDDLELKLAQ